MNAASTHHSCCTASFDCFAIAALTNIQDISWLTVYDDVLLKVFNELVAHLSFRAKKTDAFFSQRRLTVAGFQVRAA